MEKDPVNFIGSENYSGKVDVWNLYNEEIAKLMFLFKKYPKDIFVTAHYEWIQNEGGAVEKRIKVKGRQICPQ